MGKQKIQQKKMWQLEVGVLQLRCVKEENDFVVWARVLPKFPWTIIARGAEPKALLQRTVEITVDKAEALQTIVEGG